MSGGESEWNPCQRKYLIILPASAGVNLDYEINRDYYYDVTRISGGDAVINKIAQLTYMPYPH